MEREELTAGFRCHLGEFADLTIDVSEAGRAHGDRHATQNFGKICDARVVRNEEHTRNARGDFRKDFYVVGDFRQVEFLGGDDLTSITAFLNERFHRLLSSLCRRDEHQLRQNTLLSEQLAHVRRAQQASLVERALVIG